MGLVCVRGGDESMVSASGFDWQMKYELRTFVWIADHLDTSLMRLDDSPNKAQPEP